MFVLRLIVWAFAVISCGLTIIAGLLIDSDTPNYAPTQTFAMATMAIALVAIAVPSSPPARNPSPPPAQPGQYWQHPPPPPGTY